MIESVIYNDTFGKSIIIDDLHNVNYENDVDLTCFNKTHESRDGKAMFVAFNSTFGTYLVTLEN